MKRGAFNSVELLENSVLIVNSYVPASSIGSCNTILLGSLMTGANFGDTRSLFSLFNHQKDLTKLQFF
jgi:hypothetical protein